MEFDLDALLQTFQADADENLERMEETLIALENSPGDKSMLQTLFRAAHTLKGNAAIIGFTGLTEFAHRLEDCLDRLMKGTAHANSSLITALLRSVDAMRNLIASSIAGNIELQEVHRELLATLTEAEVATDTADVVKAAVETSEASEIPERRNGGDRRKEEAQGSNDRRRTLRVDIEKLDRMLNLAGEIAISRGRLRQLIDEGGSGDEMLEARRSADRLHLDLQELVMKIRMVPIGPTFRQFVRTVRDMAMSSSKYAELELEGEDVEVDTTVIDLIRDPIMHMIRNAVDHGLELPAKRHAAGKNPCGRICLRAFHETGNIIIQISDDGAGLNRKRIADTARARGLAAEPEKMADAELLRLIFEPGFSTAEKITDVSGRGVGMDVVQRNIDTLRGSVGVESEEGKGSTITIRLPLTMAIIEGFLVGVSDESYVIPLDTVIECVEMPASERGKTDEHGLISLRGRPLPYMRLRGLFGIGGRGAGREQVVVVKHHELQAGLVVDALYGENQTVIKPLGKLFQGLQGVSGSTILGNGRVALILDVPKILKSVSNAKQETVNA
jgi:two-component system chemotaxis sensor kinase CheA